MNHTEYWKFITKREVVFEKRYAEMLREELTMMFVFGNQEPLEGRLLEFSTSLAEIHYLIDLFRVPYQVVVENNGNLRVFNK